MMKISIFALLFASSQCLFAAAYDAPIIARPLLKRSNNNGTIKALLRTGKPGPDSGVHGRQADSCPPGDLPCDDGAGCCPIGYYCSVSDGQPGCCPLGETCSGSSGECIHDGDVPCPDDPNFCCPAGDSGPTITTKNSFTTSTGKPFSNTLVFSSTANPPLFSTPTSSVRLPTSVIATGPSSGATNAPTNGNSNGNGSNPFSSGASAANARASAILFIAALAFNIFAA